MYKQGSYIFIFCLALLAFGFAPSAKVGGRKQWVVVIDPGHGGKDPGCHGENFKEKDIALAVSLKLGHYLEDNDKSVKVVYTRTTDVFVPLNERADIANKDHADIFICIHLNASPNHDANGSATYVMGLRKSGGNLEVEKQENSAILYEKDYKTTYAGFDPNSKEGNIIFSMYQNLYLTQSLDLSAKIQDEYHHTEKRKDNGVKQAGFLVLWKTAMPSLLTEIGFLTNPDEEKFMGSQKGEDEIAKSIFLAFEQYKSEKDNSSYDPKSYNFKEYVVKTADTTSAADTTAEHTVIKDTTQTQIKPPAKDSVKKETTKPPKHTNKDTAWHKKIPQPPKYKDTNSERVNRMKQALKDLKPDTLVPHKVDSVVIPEKQKDTTTAKKTEQPKKKALADSLHLKKHADTSSVKKAIKKKVVTDTILHTQKHIDSVKKAELPHKKTVIEDTTTVFYKVQFALADHELPKDDKRFEGLPDISYYLDNRTYKYTAGHFTALKDAVDLQTKLRNIGYKDAFVVAFKGKRRVSAKK